MRMTLTRRLCRYFVLALATARIVAFEGAPALEGARAIAHPDAGLTVDGNAPDRSAPFHDPSTCVICQLINSVAAPPRLPTILLPTDQASGRECVAIDVPRQHVRREGVLSRAPPTHPA